LESLHVARKSTPEEKPMTKRTMFIGLLVVTFVLIADAQTKKEPCWSGDSYPSCSTLQRLAKGNTLRNAKTAAVIIEATETIACGDGSDGCFRTDGGAIATIRREVEESRLWDNLTEAEAKKADILLKFVTKNRALLQLCAYEAASNDLLWCDYRSPSIALDNDASREIVRFLGAWRSSQK
jgi:hypothetical protein